MRTASINDMILTYLISLLASLKLIHAGTFVIKLKASVKLGFLVSPVIFIWDKLSSWGMDNSDYASFVLIAIAVDHILGTIKHLRIRDFTFKKNLTGLMTKIGLVVACGLLFEGLNTIITHQTIVKDYLTIVTRLIVFLYPAGSAFGNSAVLSNGKFPPQAWLDKLRAFQDNLDPKGLTEEKEEEDFQD